MQLQISNLSKTYSNGVRALNEVSLCIPTGMFGLLGPNGAGKSSLMRTLATLQEADSGTAYLGDIDVLRDKQSLRQTLGYLPQDFGTYPDATPARLLEHFAILKGVETRNARKSIVNDLLDKTNLLNVQKRKLGGFSGGMLQRFGIAVALLGNPRLLIVDEPTAGLDPAERVKFLNLLSELGETSVVILSTHIVEDVAALCTRMAVIDKGSIRIEGDPLVFTKNLAGKIWQCVSEVDGPEPLPEGSVILSQKLLAGRTMLRVLCAKCPGSGYKSSEPSLEDVYFQTLHQYPSLDSI